MFSEIHIPSFQIKTIYPLNRKTHYLLYSEMPIISTSQINTIRPSTQINTMCLLQRYTHYISSQIDTLFRYTSLFNLLTKIHLSSFHLNILYPFLR